MSFLHAFLFIGIELFSMLLVALVMLLLGAALRISCNELVCRMHMRWPTYNREALLPPYWIYLTVAAVLAACVVIFRAYPNVAGLSRNIDKFFGYHSTRIELVLYDDDAATREAMATALTPLMQKGGRWIGYRMASRYSSHVQRADMPTHYRFSNKKMEIAMGGVLGGDTLIPVEVGLAAVARYPHIDMIPERVPAVVRTRTGNIETRITLLPRTANIFGRRPPSWKSGESSGHACYLEVQALFTRERSLSGLFSIGLRGLKEPIGSVTLEAAPGLNLRDAQYRLIGLSSIPFRHRGAATRLSDDPYAIPLYVRMLPVGLPEAGTHCDLALPRAIDPALMAASMLSGLPQLSGRIKSANVEKAVSFSPGFMNSDWIAVDPDGQGAAEKFKCDFEKSLALKARLAMIDRQCGELGENNKECKEFVDGEVFARGELERCEKRGT